MKIKSFKGYYQVFFTENFIQSINSLVQMGDIFLIDENVSDLYQNQLSDLEGSNKIIIIPSGEYSKSFDASRELIDKLMKIGFKRNHRLIAIGGGIVQDAVAFVASILFRGVQWIFVPTTLLAQGDSCIGSKTSVNFGDCKNLLGGFHPPLEIHIDSSFLSTLNRKEIRSGLGEMLHFFMIGGRRDFELFRSNFHKCYTDYNAIKLLTQRSLEIKKQMIEKDEFDQGARKVFNFGHTFGHAIEGITDYKIPHGIAVAFGMDMANNISVFLGFLEESDCAESRKLLSEIWEGIEFPILDISKYMEILFRDKKNVGNNLNLILTRGLGDMFMCEVTPDDEFVAVIEKCLNFYHRES